MESHPVGTGGCCDPALTQDTFGDDKNLSFFQYFSGLNGSSEACAATPNN
jgi:hypothetical protein